MLSMSVHNGVMQSVIMKNVFRLSVIKFLIGVALCCVRLSAIIMSVIMPNVSMLIVIKWTVEPYKAVCCYYMK
jgi:hypothetical protein